MPIGIAESPKPTAAMLESVEPAALRARISPLAGLTSFQKKPNAECWSVSRSAAVVWACAGEASESASRKQSRMRRMGVLCLEEKSEREPVRVFDPALIRPGVVHVEAERSEEHTSELQSRVD